MRSRRTDLPLSGVRVVEMASIGPGPHCGMILSDMGADVLRIDRPGGNGWPNPIADRGRHVLEANVKEPEGLALCRAAIDAADVLIEGLRPGVMERLGLGPDVCLQSNPRLIYGRITGWGQTGPLAKVAGHDINYMAITGALAAMGKSGEPPRPPLNLAGDFGGGSMLLMTGILAALFERTRSGLGQVIDAAIVDGVNSLFSNTVGLVASGSLSIDRTESVLGGASPFYRTYACADGKFISIGAIEPQFYRELLERIGAPPQMADRQNDPRSWPDDNFRLEAIFAERTRAQWCDLLEGTDACFAPVLELSEAPGHPHNLARDTVLRTGGIAQTKPAPCFSRTPLEIGTGGDGRVLLQEWCDHDVRIC